MIPNILVKNVRVKKENPNGGTVDILKEISATIEEEDIYAVLGPSGAGKSSLLRLLNRLEDPYGGYIYIEGKEIKEWDIALLRNKVGFVFQESALFEGTVIDNILYAPRIRGIKKDKERAVAAKTLETVGLEESYLDKSIDRLSGGQKQRVNIARTLALKPDILLMDEPTSALDPVSTKKIETLMKELNETYKKTIIFVSHDMEQIKRIAKRCILMIDGEAYCEGTPEQVFNCKSDKAKAFFEGGQ